MNWKSNFVHKLWKSVLYHVAFWDTEEWPYDQMGLKYSLALIKVNTLYHYPGHKTERHYLLAKFQIFQKEI